jgi:hypothetical protein
MKTQLIIATLTTVFLVTACGKNHDMEADAKLIAQFECDTLKVIKDPSNVEFLTKMAGQEAFIIDLNKKYRSDNYSAEDKSFMASAIAKETAACSK